MAARRPGLVAKKISVQGKLGKRHMRTYWIRPQVAALSRLRRAKKEGLRTEAPIVLQMEHPRAGLKAFFASRGQTLSDQEVDRLINIFKKPDGTMVTGDDFDKLFPNPGPTAMPLKRLNGKTTPWGQDDTEFVKNPDGSQKMGHYDVKINLQFSISENSASMTGRVMGTPIFPPGHARAGQPTGEAPVQMNESLSRQYTKTSDGVSVYHALFVMQPAFQGGGLGASLIENQFKQYEAIGVKKVRVTGAWMGMYYWGSCGFEADSSNRADAASNFKSWMTKLQGGGARPTEANVRNGNSSWVRDCSPGAGEKGYPMIPGPLKKRNGTPYTVAELEALHSYTKADGTKRSTSDVYRTKVEVLMPDGTVKEIQIWKDVILSTRQGFAGEVGIKPGDRAYEAVRSYYGMRPKVGTPEGDAFDRAEKARIRRQTELRPQHEAQSIRLLEPDRRAAAERAARAETERRVRQEAEAAAAAEAERVRRARAVIEAPLLNPAGQPTANELHNLINNRVDNSVWSPVQAVGVADRAAWVNAPGGPGTRALRQQAVDAMTGELSMRRAMAGLELARRYTSAGQNSQAASYRNNAATFREEAVTRARADEARGNAGATTRLSAIEAEAITARAAADVHTAAVIAGAATGARAPVVATAPIVTPGPTPRVETTGDIAARRATEVAAARNTAVGPPPPARPRAGSNAQAQLASRHEQFRRMTPAQRAAYVADGYNPQARARRQTELDELTGAAAQARADHANREAAFEATQGNAAGARNARTRARREQAEATRLAAELATSETTMATRRGEAAADAPRAQALISKQEQEVARIAAEYHTVRSAYWRSSSSTPEGQAAIAEHTRVQQSLSQARERLGQLQRLASQEHVSPSSINDASEGDRQASRATLQEKEGRIATRRAEIARQESEVRRVAEEAFRATIKADKPRARAMLVEQDQEVSRLAQEYRNAKDRLRNTEDDSSDQDHWVQRVEEAGEEMRQADKTRTALTRLARGSFTLEEMGQYQAASAKLAAKEGRVATRQAAEHAAREAAAEAEFKVALKADRPRAKQAVARQEQEVQDTKTAVTKAENALDDFLAGPDGFNPRAMGRYMALNEARGEAITAHNNAKALQTKLTRLARGEFTRAEASEVESTRQAIQAKEERAHVREVERQAAAKEEEFKATLQADRPRAQALLAKQEEVATQAKATYRAAQERARSLPRDTDAREEAEMLADDLGQRYEMAQDLHYNLQRLAEGRFTRSEKPELAAARLDMAMKEDRIATRAANAQAEVQRIAAANAARLAEKQATKAARAEEASATLRLAEARRVAKAEAAAAQAASEAAAASVAATPAPATARPQYATRTERGRRSQLTRRL